MQWQRIILLLNMLISSWVVVVGQVPDPGSEGTVSNPDALLAKAADQEGEDRRNTLERAVELAEQMSFDEAVRRGYRELIELYAEGSQIAQELKTRVQFLNYLNTKTEDKAEEARVEFGIGKFYLDQKIYDRAADRFGKAQTLSKEAGNDSLLYESMKYYAWSQHQQGFFLRSEGLGGNTKDAADLAKSAYRDARNAYERVLDLAEKLGREPDQLWIHQQLARVAHAEMNYQEELSHSKEALELAKRQNKPDDVIKALNNLGYTSKFLNRDAEALGYFEQALKELQFNSDPGLEADVLLNIGVIQHNQGRSLEAIEYLQKAAQKAIRIGRIESAGNAYDFMALVYFQQKDQYNALAYNEKSIAIAEKNDYPDLLVKSYNTRSVIYKSLYEFEYALDAQKKYLDLKDSITDLRRSELSNRQLKEREIQSSLERMLELQQLKLKDELVEEEKRRLQKELELASSQEERTRLEALQILDQLALEKQKGRISDLARQQLINQIELNEEKAKADSARQDALLQEKIANEMTEAAKQEKLRADLEEAQKNQHMLENERQQENIRNLTLVLVGGGLLMFIILLTLIQLRVRNRQIRRQRKEIVAAKQKSDELLLNILPVAVAEELKESGQSKPRLYEAATVLFTDFVGFTMISEGLSPSELVKTLDEIFLEFDLIVEKHGLQRIKTIGDAYMAACGLPETDLDHAAKAVRAAIEMRDFIRDFNAGLPPGSSPWNIRIGLNSGPLVAGVVGVRKFAYDIWGDAVNTASRMESSGKPGKVNISGSTKELLNGKFVLEYRGKVAAKNKGEIDMYFVELS